MGARKIRDNRFSKPLWHKNLSLGDSLNAFLKSVNSKAIKTEQRSEPNFFILLSRKSCEKRASLEASSYSFNTKATTLCQTCPR